MEITNVVRVKYDGISKLMRARALTQYDYGQVLAVDGVELPETFEAIFSDCPEGEAVTVIGCDGSAAIPDMYLQKPGMVFCWIFLHDGTDDGRTVLRVEIPVRPRAEATDIEVTPAEQNVITETIAALNDAVDTAAQYAEDARNSAIAAREEEAFSPRVSFEEVEGGVNVTIEDKDGEHTAYIHSGIDGRGIASVSLGADYKLVLNYTDGTYSPKLGPIRGPSGRDGRDGIDGDPGVYYGEIEPTDPDATVWIDPTGEPGELTATVSKEGHTATIEVTDKNGTTTAEVHDGESGVYYGEEEPEDPDATVWIDPTGAAGELAANVTKENGVATISITDKDGTTTAEVCDGNPGLYYGTERPTDPGIRVWVDPSGSAGELAANVSKSGSTATISITDKNGTTTAEVQDGDPGVYYGTERPTDPDVKIWVDPSGSAAELTANVSKSGNTATITITDKNGTTSAQVHDGGPGVYYGTETPTDPDIKVWVDPSESVIEPTATVSKSGGTTTITITDKDGTTTANVLDGATGADGTMFTPAVSAEGVISWTNDGGKTNPASVNIKGPQGEPGQNGTNGTSAYVWIRYAAAQPAQDSDMKTTPDAWMGIYSGDAATAPTAYTSYTWYNIKGQTGPVTDVQVDGTSIVTSGVANVPKATATTLGLVKAAYGYGSNINANGEIVIYPAGEGTVKSGVHNYQPVTPAVQHDSTFYGLAKAAGDSTQSASSNAVGTYTETAKSKISDMLNAPVTVSGSTPSITGMSGVRYICGECSTLSITAPASGIIDVTFESGSTPTVLTVTSAKTGVTNIRWANGFDSSNLDANTTYEISVMDGELGAALSWT